MSSPAELARTIPLFAGLEGDQVERLLGGAQPRDFDRKTILFKEGQPADCLYILLKGVVELYTRSGNRRAVILVVFPPEAFLAAAALNDQPCLMSACTIGPARLLPLDAALLREEVSRNPELAMRFTQLLSAQFRMTVRHVKELKMRGGTRRLGAFLLRLIDEIGQDGCVDLPISKKSLASKLGLSAETASRAFPTLRDHGLTMRGSRIVLTDRKAFERFCGRDPLIDGRDAGLPMALL